jgi:hypothetical protein
LLPHSVPISDAVHKPKPYKYSICEADVPNLPMPVFKHQLSHVRRRPFARGRKPVNPDQRPDRLPDPQQ